MDNKLYLRAKLELLEKNFVELLRTKTKPYTPQRFKKKQRLKELDVKIKELKERLNNE